MYYIIQGTATFPLGDDTPAEARRGDAVLIPRGTSYELWGDVEYLVVNSPAFSGGDDIYDEPSAA